MALAECLVGRQGSITFPPTNKKYIIVKYHDSPIEKLESIKDLSYWIKELEVTSTTNGAISMGTWEKE